MTLEAIFYERDKVSRQEGIEEGIEKGREEEREELIFQMLTMHAPEEIAAFTGIDLERIIEIKEKHSK